MSRILKELFYGNLEPSVKLEENDPRLRHLERLIGRHLETLEKKLCKEDKTVFEKYIECCNEYEFLVTEKAFCDGFCMATRIVAEAMCLSEKQIPN